MNTQTTAPSSAAPGALAWTLLALLGVIWGSSFMLSAIAVRETPPLTLAALRLIFAAGFLLIAMKLSGARLPLRRRTWAFAFGGAMLGAVFPFALISWALQHIPSALVGLLMAPMPLISLVLAYFMVSGEALTPARVAGFMCGLLGLVLLIGWDAVALLGAGGAIGLLGQLAALGAMLCYALNGIVLKRAHARDPFGFSAALMLIAALVAAPVALIVEAPALGAISAPTWATIAGIGLGATALAQIIMMKIIDLTGPPFLASVNYQAPLWAAAFGVLLLGETLPGAFWAALALILLGLAIAQFGGRARG